MDKYNDSNIDNIPKRSVKNQELYKQIYNAYDEFENLVVPSNAKEIDFSNLKREISSRDEYKKIKDYSEITNNKVVRKEIIIEEQKKENEIYDINELLNTTESMKISMTDTMRKCGGCCLSTNAIKIAKKLYAKSNDIAEFLNLLNEADIGGRNLHISDGKIIAVYKKCYCNIPLYLKYSLRERS